MTNKIQISIIIVSYNTAKVVKHAIDSVLKQKNINFEIIVIDNNSPDNSVEIIKSYGEQIKFISNNENLGFGKANNLAEKQAQGEYLYLLNPDACFVDDDALEKAFNYMQSHSHVGLAGTVIQNWDGAVEDIPKKLYPGQKRAPKSFAHLMGDYAWTIGASMMVNRNIFKSVNGFDEDYFLYGEEQDLCLRLRKAKYEIGFIEDIAVRHWGGASESQTDLYQYWLKKQSALHLFWKKHVLDDERLKLLKHDLKVSSFRKKILCLKRALHCGFNSDKLQKYSAIHDSTKKELVSFYR